MSVPDRSKNVPDLSWIQSFQHLWQFSVLILFTSLPIFWDFWPSAWKLLLILNGNLDSVFSASMAVFFAHCSSTNCIQLAAQWNLVTAFPASIAVFIIVITSWALHESLELTVSSRWVHGKMHWQVLIWREVWSLFVMVLVLYNIKFTLTSSRNLQSIFGKSGGKNRV